MDFINGGGPEKPTPQRYSESHQGVLTSTDYGRHFRQRLGAPVSSLRSTTGGGGGGGGGGSERLGLQLARHSEGSNKGGGGGSSGTLPNIGASPRASEPGVTTSSSSRTTGYVMPSDKAAYIRRTTPANPKVRDAMKRIKPKFIVGTRNPITAEWAIDDSKVGAPSEVFVPSSAGAGSLPLPCPPVLGAKDSRTGMWRVKPNLGFDQQPELMHQTRGRLSDKVNWEPLPEDVARDYRRNYGEFAPETKRVATYKDTQAAEKGTMNPITGTWTTLPNDRSKTALTTTRGAWTQRKNQSHFEAGSELCMPDRFSQREQEAMTKGAGIRRYLTSKNEGHFTQGGGFTPTRAMPPAPALFGITGNGVWA